MRPVRPGAGQHPGQSVTAIGGPVDAAPRDRRARHPLGPVDAPSPRRDRRLPRARPSASEALADRGVEQPVAAEDVVSTGAAVDARYFAAFSSGRIARSAREARLARRSAKRSIIWLMRPRGFFGVAAAGARRTGGVIFSNVNAGIECPLVIEMNNLLEFPCYPDEAQLPHPVLHSIRMELVQAQSMPDTTSNASTLRTDPHDPKVIHHVRSALPDIRGARGGRRIDGPVGRAP